MAILFYGAPQGSHIVQFFQCINLYLMNLILRALGYKSQLPRVR
jgi:hypothetical protein